MLVRLLGCQLDQALLAARQEEAFLDIFRKKREKKEKKENGKRKKKERKWKEKEKKGGFGRTKE